MASGASKSRSGPNRSAGGPSAVPPAAPRSRLSVPEDLVTTEPVPVPRRATSVTSAPLAIAQPGVPPVVETPPVAMSGRGSPEFNLLEA